MAGKSVGQWVGTIVGGAVGAFFGYPALGASIGGLAGGMIDPPKGPTVVGPRLDDLSFQSSTLGAPLGRGYGTFPVLGNVVWLEHDQYREATTTEEQGGKGGGGTTYETSRYYATFAVSLLRITDPAQTVALRRLWIGSNLVFDAGSDDIQSIIASNSSAKVNFTFYSGTNDQQPNPRWQADKGINAVSGFPGRCYIVIEDLDLEPYSRSLAMAQVKAELVVGSPTIEVIEDTTPVIKNDPYSSNANYDRYLSTVIITQTKIDSALVRMLDNGTNFYAEGINTWSNEIAVANGFSSATGSAVSGQDGGRLILAQSDRNLVISVKSIHPTHIDRRLELFEEGAPLPTVGHDYPVLNKLGEIALVDGNEIFTVPYKVVAPILRYSSAEFVEESAQWYQAVTAGYSENYIFLIDDYSSTSTNCRVVKVSRTTLAIVDHVDFALDGRYAAISVVSDSLCYVAAANQLWRSDGASAAYVGDWVAGIPIDVHSRNWFKVFSENPPYLVFAQEDLSQTQDVMRVWVTRQKVPKTAALLSDIITAEAGLVGIQPSDLDLSSLAGRYVDGIRLAGKLTPRSTIEALQPVHPFDVAVSGYKLRFKVRGGSPVATITEDELGTGAGGEKAQSLLPISREMDSQLPSKVSIKFLDYNREYDLGEQYAEYPSPAANERTLELPIVMTDSQAAQAADVLIQKDWIERSTFGPFSLPPTRRALEGADVINIQHRGQQHELRLTRVEYLPDGRLECSGVRSSAQTFTSTAQPQGGLVLGQSVVSLPGSSAAVLLDIPTIISAQNTTGIVFGLYGLAAGWPGATLVRSDDGGVTWANAGSTNDKLRVFDASTTLGSGEFYSLDIAARLTVKPRVSSHALYSLSVAQFFSGTNIAAYGADGRWEIVNFKTVVDNGDGTFTLRDFRRGMFGTERYMTTHAAGDVLVMLGSAVGFASLPIAALGSTRKYRAITQGASIDSAPDTALTYAGVNLLPLSGVKINGSRHRETFDWTVTWCPRSRTPVELFSGFQTPSGESSVGYVAEVWNSTYTTLKRTFSGLTSPTFSYMLAEQVADFGDKQGVLYLRLYQVSPTTGRGAVFQTTIDRYAFPDPYLLQVTCLMHMDTTALTEQLGATVTINGNAARSAVQSKFGGYSGMFDGTGDYLQLSAGSRFALSTGNFTIEAFIYISADSSADLSGNRAALIFSIGTTGGTERNVTLAIGGSSTTTGTHLIADVAGTSYGSLASTITKSAWHHVALCRSGTTCGFFLDGVRISTFTSSGDAGSSANPGFVGGRPYGGSNYYWYLNGYIDELRVTKAARYTGATYIVPTAAFPNP